MLAWTFIDNPKVLILDESTSGIDIGGEETVYSLLHRLWQKGSLTIILVSHSMSIVWKHATNVLCINKDLVCYGKPEETLNQDVLKKYTVQRFLFMNIAILFEYSAYLALIIGVAIGSVTALIGSLMVAQKMPLMAGALGHLTLPGIALALKYDFDISIGAFLFLIIGIFLFGCLRRRQKLPLEAITATVFSTAIATMFLFLPEEKTYVALLGDVSQLTLKVTFITVILAGITFFMTRAIFKKIVLIALSRDIAQTRGIKSDRYNFLYLFCIALMVALCIRVVGGLMTAALVAIPASASKNISSNMMSYM